MDTGDVHPIGTVKWEKNILPLPKRWPFREELWEKVGGSNENKHSYIYNPVSSHSSVSDSASN